MSDAPFSEKPVSADADTADSKAARERLTKVLADLNPAAGKSDDAKGPGNAKKKKKRAERKNQAQP